MVRSRRFRFKLALGALAVLLSLVACAPGRSFDRDLSLVTSSYQFKALRWQLGALLGQFNAQPSSQGQTADIDLVKDYFAAMRQPRSPENAAALDLPAPKPSPLDRAAVSQVLKTQVRETLNKLGIYNPADRFLNLKVTFPPISFKIEEPPYVLVVSARERVQTLRTVTLAQDLTEASMVKLEAETDKLGVSSVVVELGGFAGTYPVFVANQSDLRSAIDTIAHEWLHQYLAFTPLGLAYVLDQLDISRNTDIIVMNETAAGIFGREVSALVMREYYGQEVSGRRGRPAASPYDRVMRETRLAVDQHLAKGEVALAEAFMEQQRLKLASMGYRIRKLNQAYLAFHGNYADSPGSVNPIGSEMNTLRDRQGSLKGFLAAASMLGGRQDLARSIQ